MCLNPIVGFWTGKLNENGKRIYVFANSSVERYLCDDMLSDVNLESKDIVRFINGHYYLVYRQEMPCRKCIECRLQRAKQWSMRNIAELSVSSSAVFVTLTYSEDFLPKGGNLFPRDATLFIKRLRKKFQNVSIRYFLRGEYGSKTFRPHYHIILYGVSLRDFNSRFFYSHKERNIYRSAILEQLWTYGYSCLEEVTDANCSYISGYMTKKINLDIRAIQKNLVPCYTRNSNNFGFIALSNIFDYNTAISRIVSPKRVYYCPIPRSLRERLFNTGVLDRVVYYYALDKRHFETEAEIKYAMFSTGLSRLELYEARFKKKMSLNC